MREEHQKESSRGRTRREFLKLGIGGLVGGAALLAACTPQAAAPAPAKPAESKPAETKPAEAASKPAETKPAETKPAAPQAAPAAAAKPGAALTVAWGLDPRGFDVAIGDARPEQNLNIHVYDSLIDLNNENKLVPSLAESWAPTADLTYRFNLRKGVKFHDGTPFNAEVVKWNFERFINPDTKATVLNYFRWLDKVTVVDENTVDLTLKTPAPLALKYIASYGYQASPKSVESIATKPVGTGPFRFGEWVKGDHITLEANPDYWGTKAALGKLTFKTLPQPTSRVAALRAGEADVVIDLDPTAAKELEGGTDAKIASVPGYRNIYLLVDHRADTPLKKREVRQALNLAIDKDALIAGLLEGYGTPLEGQPYSPMYYGYNPGIKKVGYDPAQAKKLLADAGYGSGFEIKFVTPFGRYLKDKELTEAIAGQLEKVGVKATIEVVEWAAAMQKYISHTNGPLAMNGQASPSLDCLEHFTIYWWSKGAVSHYENPAFDAIYEKANVEMNEQTREKLLQDAVKILADDYANIWLHQQHDLYGLRNRVQNWTPPNNQLLDFRKASAS
jgi:peptide/nickel transport system substrate-binding protein